jgi:hypothetical protein
MEPMLPGFGRVPGAPGAGRGAPRENSPQRVALPLFAYCWPCTPLRGGALEDVDVDVDVEGARPVGLIMRVSFRAR